MGAVKHPRAHRTAPMTEVSSPKRSSAGLRNLSSHDHPGCAEMLRSICLACLSPWHGWGIGFIFQNSVITSSLEPFWFRPQSRPPFKMVTCYWGCRNCSCSPCSVSTLLFETDLCALWGPSAPLGRTLAFMPVPLTFLSAGRKALSLHTQRVCVWWGDTGGGISSMDLLCPVRTRIGPYNGRGAHPQQVRGEIVLRAGMVREKHL